MSVGPRILLLVVSVVVPAIVEEGVPDDEDGFSNISNIGTSALFPNPGGTDIHNQALSLSLLSRPHGPAIKSESVPR